VFEQLSLFDQHDRAGAVVDRIREKYGFGTVMLATQMGGESRSGKVAKGPASRPRGA